MRNVHGLSTGWTDTSIGELVRSRAEALTRFMHGLITSIDSSTELREVPTVSGCILGLGDGIGMNFVTPDADITSYFELGAVPAK